MIGFGRLQIDNVTGAITSASGELHFRASLEKTEFLKSKAGMFSKLVVDNPPFTTFQVREGSSPWGYLLCWKGEKLSNVSFATGSDSGWADWSLENELKLLNEYSAFLRKTLGPAPWKYSWGEVSAVSDFKTGDSSIRVAYVHT